jgi:hypothetical protein
MPRRTVRKPELVLNEALSQIYNLLRTPIGNGPGEITDEAFASRMQKLVQLVDKLQRLFLRSVDADRMSMVEKRKDVFSEILKAETESRKKEE